MGKDILGGNMERRLNLLKKFLEEKKLYSYSDLISSMIKEAAGDLVLNKKTFSDLKSSIINRSMNIVSDDLFSKRESEIIELSNRIFEKLILSPQIKSQRGLQLLGLKWITISILDSKKGVEILQPVEDRDIDLGIDVFLSLVNNLKNIYYNEETQSFWAKKNYYIFKNISAAKESGYAPISNTDFLSDSIFDFSISDIDGFFEDNEEFLSSEMKKKRDQDSIAFGSNLVYDKDGITVTFLSSHDACHLLYFSNTKWCITETESNMWDTHSDDDNLYFFVIENRNETNKSETLRLVAIPFSFKDIYYNEIRDADDNNISIDEVSNYLGKEKFEEAFASLQSYVDSLPNLTPGFSEALDLDPNHEFKISLNSSLDEAYEIVSKNDSIENNGERAGYFSIYVSLLLKNSRDKNLFSAESSKYLMPLFSKDYTSISEAKEINLSNSILKSNYLEDILLFFLSSNPTFKGSDSFYEKIGSFLLENRKKVFLIISSSDTASEKIVSILKETVSLCRNGDALFEKLSNMFKGDAASSIVSESLTQSKIVSKLSKALTSSYSEKKALSFLKGIRDYLSIDYGADLSAIEDEIYDLE